MENDGSKQAPANPLDENYSFDGNTYTYTDKISNIVYIWDLEKNSWVDKSQLVNTNPLEESIKQDGGHSSVDKSQSETTNSASEPKTPVDNNVSVEKSKLEIPNLVTKSLKKATKSKKSDDEEEDSDEEPEKPEPMKQDMSKGVYGFEDDTYTYTDATDGTKYFWDKQKSAWFPKIDDDFIAYYQMSYGFNQPEDKKDDKPLAQPPQILPDTVSKKSEEPEPTLKRKAPEEPPKWFELDDKHNTKVYVTNLPLDITETEFVDIMQKCGLVMKDVDTGKMKIKLYSDPETKQLKGDALCTYIKKESVDLALNLLDGYDVRGHQIKIEKAQFTMKGQSYDPNLKPKKKRRKDKEKIKKMQEKLFAWQPDKLRGERPKNERVVVLKNLFDPKLFDQNLSLILEYRQDLQEECAKCGALKKVVVYDKHPDGVAQIWFKDAEAADACVQLLNNRWFSQRKITAETWDGKTRYKIQETPEEEEARLKKWEEFLNTNKDADNATIEDKNNEDADAGMNDDSASDGTRSSAGSGDDTDEEGNG
ncbi:hypothetical protein V9T40_001869 [Parthenolecanium corni]|uniref:17S U2 SnRNP complex component HTATSF1 n=1 Tax=Parthenolecanium corni TaxID=536013 RepID=A0AAN9TWB5_9HEMI